MLESQLKMSRLHGGICTSLFLIKIKNRADLIQTIIKEKYFGLLGVLKVK
ncbi:hypothetical protein AP058_00348 [Flavobacterium sp. TAB 87]|nr:hypothetical protein AP058_00348 [Flavobacterium sp. TAB 87]